MSALQIAIISNHCEIVVGESLDVKVVLKNAGSAAIEVPSPSEPIQFEFLLRSVPQQMVVYELSRLQALAARSDEPIPASATRTISLAAGNSASYEDNLSRFTVEPLQPGNYLLSAAYRTSSGRIESPGVSLVISAPKLCALALAASLSGLHQAMIHQASPGRAVLLQRLGSAQNPEDGMWYHRGDMSSAMRPRQCGGGNRVRAEPSGDVVCLDRRRVLGRRRGPKPDSFRPRGFTAPWFENACFAIGGLARCRRIGIFCRARNGFAWAGCAGDCFVSCQRSDEHCQDRAT